MCLFVLQTITIVATETIIIGDITNETTGEPIPNVNIHFRGTKIGTTSDPSGAYILRVDLHKKMQLVFSAVGYHTQRYDIEPGTVGGLHIALVEKTAMLTEVIAVPGKNPALDILKKVREKQTNNDRTLLPNHPLVHREQNLYVSHINQRHLRRALWSSLQAGMIMQEDSSYILPLYRETQSFQIKGQEMIPANDKQTQAIILTSTDYSFLLQTEGNFNFYKTTIPILGHAFLSPLAASGTSYYQYYLVDSITSAQPVPEKHYIIRFRTRNPFYPTFNGELTIDSASYALREIDVHAPVENSVNYLKQLHITQTLANDNSIEEEMISAIIDFDIKTTKAGTTFPTLLLTSHLTIQDTSSVIHNNQSIIHNSQYTTHNTQSATHNTQSTIRNTQPTPFSILDSIPVIRVAKWIATICATGYIPTGTKVDFGHVSEIIQVNRHEGIRIGLPLRTNASFSERVALEAAVGYGFRDRAFKGLGRVSIDLPTERRHQMHIEYNDGYAWAEVDEFDNIVRDIAMGLGGDLSYAFESLYRDSLCVNTAVRQRQVQLHWFADWTPNIETHTFVRAGWHNALPITDKNPHSITFDPYAFQSLSFIARLSWREKKYDGFFTRRYTYYSPFPVLYMGFEIGHWAYTAPHSPSNIYAHLRFMLSQQTQLGIGGDLSYALQAGAIFGKAPMAKLWHADSNQGYTFDPYRFTLMHGGEIIADKYIALHAEWDGQGLLFNNIPGLRWLHLHELIEAKIAYGYCSSKYQTYLINTNPTPHSLYAEIGVGIGNILRVCDLYSIWSLSPKIEWGMRFRIHF